MKLVPESIQDEVMRALLVILNEKEEAQFNTLHEGFLKRYSLVAPAFTKHYRDSYTGRVEKRAMCFQQFEHCKADTNMFVEFFHNKLKTFFMERRPNKRVDDLINLLLTIEEEDYWSRKRDVEYYESLAGQPTDQINRHEKGINIPDAHVNKIDEEIYEVVSQSNNNYQYLVKKINNKCNDRDCLERFDSMFCLIPQNVFISPPV